jgi:hypothetical protein
VRCVVIAGLVALLSANAHPQAIREATPPLIPQAKSPRLIPRGALVPGETIGSQANVFIAIKGHVCTAIAYWVQGDTLHYITAQGSHNQVSLVLVDRQTSAKLNAGRLVKLVLPPP